MKPDQISILGCGWLGMPLAAHLIKNEYKVKGSTTSQSKISEMRDKAIEAFLITLEETEIDGFIEAFLSESQTLIIAIPPGLRKQPQLDYVAKIKQIIPYIEEASIEQVLYISSTSVYLDTPFFPITTESREFYSESKVAVQLLEVEALLQQNSSFKTTVLRFSGLFDEKRHPAKFLSGRKNIKNPEAPVNLIHQTDCIRIICRIIERNAWGNIYHAAAASHPTKSDYYKRVCKAMNIAAPEYDTVTPSEGKLIVSTKLMDALDFEFQVDLK